MKYAGVPTERLHVVEDLATGSTARWSGGRRRALRPPHLHGAAGAARPAVASAARPGSTGGERRSCWHDVECGGYAADLPLWRELADAEAGPVLDVGAGDRPRRARPRARRPRRHRARPRRRAAGGAARARAAATALAVRTAQADAAGFELSGAAVRPHRRADADVQLLPGRAGARRASSPAPATHLAPGGLVALAVAEELEPFEADLEHPLPPDTAERDGWRYRSPPGRGPRRAATASCSSACG